MVPLDRFRKYDTMFFRSFDIDKYMMSWVNRKEALSAAFCPRRAIRRLSIWLETIAFLCRHAYLC